MKDIIDDKIIRNAINMVLLKNYKCEICIFGGALFCLICIEFSSFRFPSIWDEETCIKVNNIILQLSLAYIATFIFFYFNIFRKEKMKYKNYYPQIVAMLKNIFKIFDCHEKYLESEYKARNKDLKFNYEKENILQIIKYIKDEDKLFVEAYKNSNENHRLPSSVIEDSNYYTATKISNEIEMLNRFNDFFDYDYQMILFRILTNHYILSYKNVKVNNLDFYESIIEEEILLYNEINKLRMRSKSIFKIEL